MTKTQYDNLLAHRQTLWKGYIAAADAYALHQGEEHRKKHALARTAWLKVQRDVKAASKLFDAR